MLVKLSLPEWSAALDAAWLRIATSTAQQLNAATTYERSMVDRVREELIGVAGELAVAKYRGQFFIPGINTFHCKSDCGSDIEVRSTSHPDGHLIVRDNDSPGRRYVLAVVDGKGIRLAGWMTGENARRPEWRRASKRSDRPAWWVPQEELKDVKEMDLA